MNRKTKTISELRKELDSKNVGYMSNWTKPVLINRLEEEDKWAKYKANQDDAVMAYESELDRYEIIDNELGKEIQELDEKRNKLVREKIAVHKRVEELSAVVKLTKPTF